MLRQRSSSRRCARARSSCASSAAVRRSGPMGPVMGPTVRPVPLASARHPDAEGPRATRPVVPTVRRAQPDEVGTRAQARHNALPVAGTGHRDPHGPAAGAHRGASRRQDEPTPAAAADPAERGANLSDARAVRREIAELPAGDRRDRRHHALAATTGSGGPPLERGACGQECPSTPVRATMGGVRSTMARVEVPPPPHDGLSSYPAGAVICTGRRWANGTPIVSITGRNEGPLRSPAPAE